MTMLFLRSSFVFLAIWVALVLSDPHLLAQSFLSGQRVVTENSRFEQQQQDDALQKKDPTVLQDTGNHQSNHKRLLRPQPFPNKSISEAEMKEKSGFAADEQVEDFSSVPLHLSFNTGSIFIISNLINNGEYNLALEILNNLPSEIEEKVEKEREFYLREVKQYYLVRVHFHLGNFEKVINAAKEYIQVFSNGSMYYEVYYYFAAASSNLEKPIQLTYLVTDEFFTQLSNRKSTKLRQYLIQDALNGGQYLTAFSYLENAKRHLIPDFEKWVAIIIEKIEEIADIDAVLEQHENKTVKSQAYLQKVRILVRQGNYHQAQSLLDFLLLNEEIDEKFIGDLQSLQNFITIALNTEPDRIGVILPFSHKQFGRLAREVLDGLELALKSKYSGGRAFQLILRDSAPKKLQEKAKRLQPRMRVLQRVNLVKHQIRELVEDERVIMIFGPLTKRTSLAAGEIAEIYKVPIVCFSKTENIGKDLPYLFRFQRNKMQEAETLAQYAVDYLSAKRFVLFYYSDSSGRGFKVIQSFKEVVQQNGGEIVGVSKIKPRQTDFQDSFLSITGGFRKISEEEKEELKKTRERLKPIVDFDVVFAPVKLDTLKIIMDFCNLFEAQSVWVLAGSETNVTENQLFNNKQRLRFVDAFPISNVKTYLQPFFESHWKAYNFRKGYRSPTEYTIFAYEAMEVITKLLNDPKHHNRESLKDAINNLRAFPVLTGNAHTSVNGEIGKDLTILRIRGKNTVSIF